MHVHIRKHSQITCTACQERTYTSQPTVVTPVPLLRATYREEGEALVDLLRVPGQAVLGQGDEVALTADKVKQVHKDQGL